MARAFYSHETIDQDLNWLISNFLYERPNYLPVDHEGACVIFIRNSIFLVGRNNELKKSKETETDLNRGSDEEKDDKDCVKIS